VSGGSSFGLAANSFPFERLARALILASVSQSRYHLIIQDQWARF
jgi:hypothetical protein